MGTACGGGAWFLGIGIQAISAALGISARAALTARKRLGDVGVEMPGPQRRAAPPKITTEAMPWARILFRVPLGVARRLESMSGMV